MNRLSLLKAMVIAGAAAAASSTLTDASAQTIDDAMASAYRTNPQLLSSRAQLRALDEGVPQALSGWRPTVTLNGSLGKARDVTRRQTTLPGDVSGGTTVTEGPRTPDAASVQLTQPLYRGGQTLAQTSQAENNVQAGRASLVSVEQQVLLQAATAYANLLRDQATLELSINNEEVLRRQLEQTQNQFDVGQVTRTDVSQAEARLEQARAAHIQAEGNLASTGATYERITGQTAPPKVSTPHLPPYLPQNYDDVRAGIANNPDIVAARYNEKAAADAVDVFLGQKLPLVNLTGIIQRNTETGGGVGRGVQQDNATVAVTVTMPLYQAGLIDAQARQAKETAGQRRIDIQTQQRSTIEVGVQNWDLLNSARAQVTSFTSQVRASEIALEGITEEQRVGLRTVIEVLNAEQDLFTARVNLVSAQRDETVFAYQLAASVGHLTAAELALQVELYDAVAHYNDVRGRWYGTNIDNPDRNARGLTSGTP
ncbi:MAG TPA: TolC family outer membrane protein [Alphaproteobacteria bacterium]